MVRADHNLPRIWNGISALSLYRAITYQSGGSVRASRSRFLPATRGRYAVSGGAGHQPSPARDIFAYRRGLGAHGRRGPRQRSGAWPLRWHGIRAPDIGEISARTGRSHTMNPALYAPATLPPFRGPLPVNRPAVTFLRPGHESGRLSLQKQPRNPTRRPLAP
jgi:hypothetical protein